MSGRLDAGRTWARAKYQGLPICVIVLLACSLDADTRLSMRGNSEKSEGSSRTVSVFCVVPNGKCAMPKDKSSQGIGDEAKRAFDAMMEMKKIDVAAIEAARLMFTGTSRTGVLAELGRRGCETIRISLGRHGQASP
jgi:hypothetical protein